MQFFYLSIGQCSAFAIQSLLNSDARREMSKLLHLAIIATVLALAQGQYDYKVEDRNNIIPIIFQLIKI